MNIKKAEAIALLVFLLMIKDVQPNSVLFADAAYKMAARIGMGDGRTFSKYLRRCEELDLCTSSIQQYNVNSFRTAYTFISYRKAVALLLGINKYKLPHFPLHRGLGKHTAYKDAIERDLFGVNVKQQEFNSRTNFPNKSYLIGEINRLSALSVSGKLTRSERNMKRSLVKKFVDADRRIMESRMRGHLADVVTGCKHLAAIIGKSGATASKRIKKWQSKDLLKVEDVIGYTPTSSREEGERLAEGMRASGIKGFHVYSVKEKGVKSIMGKRIIAYVTHSFAYTSEHLSRPI